MVIPVLTSVCTELPVTELQVISLHSSHKNKGFLQDKTELHSTVTTVLGICFGNWFYSHHQVTGCHFTNRYYFFHISDRLQSNL